MRLGLRRRPVLLAAAAAGLAAGGLVRLLGLPWPHEYWQQGGGLESPRCIRPEEEAPDFSAFLYFAFTIG